MLEAYVLTANSQADLLIEQARRFQPAAVVIADESKYAYVSEALASEPVQVYAGAEALCQVVQMEPVDMVLTALVGFAGLRPTLSAVEAGKPIALANKETLVVAGELVTAKCLEKGVPMLPVDSEHSAIFQCLEGMNKKDELKSIILTASGGPFFGKTREELETVTLAQALKHPNWEMGAKITVDSATMMNKGLELIEAVWLFGVEPSMIDIVVHRESIIHSLIEYNDNSVIAQLGVPDMRIPIQYALTYPERFESPVRKLNLWEYSNLTFYKPDYETFRAINICREAITKGGLYPCVANGANEMANYLFRQGKIGFLDIADLVQKATEKTPLIENYTIDDVLEADKIARESVAELIN